MTADVSENVDQEKLLGDFKARYQQLLEDNKKMVDQIKANENQALSFGCNRNARVSRTT